MKVIQKIFLLSLALGLFSCEAMQDSSGRALENAGSVVRTGKQKLYIPPEPVRRDIEESDYERY